MGDRIDILELWFPLLRFFFSFKLLSRSVVSQLLWSSGLFSRFYYLEFLFVLFFRSCTEKIGSRDLMVCCFKEQISQLRNISTANKTGDLWS